MLSSLIDVVRRWSPWLVWLAVLGAGRGASAQMVVESLDGPVTSAEVQSFKTYVAGIPLDTRNQNPSNKYAYKLQGGAMEALGDMHAITGDQAILDRMIRFTDAILSGRNDLVNGEHTVMWSGSVQPVWPNSVGGTCWAGELGDILAHIGYTAVRILRTPALANVVVPDGNPYGFGATYRQRALRYVAEVDESLDEAILPFIIQSNLEQRFPADFCYKANQRVPWNQQSMFNGGFQRQAEAHEILGDAPSRVSLYDDIVRTSVQLFLSGGPTGAADPVACGSGQTCYKWAYNVDSGGIEDTGHGAYDVLGVYRAWRRGRAGVTETQIKRLASTLMYRMRLSGHTFAAKVDGSGGNATLDAEWMFLAHVLPDLYSEVAANMQAKFAKDPRKYGRLMYIKHIRHIGQTALLEENGGGFCDVDGSVDSNHAGYTGSGFANSINAVGAGVAWRVTVGGGTHTLEWRYANGGTAGRPGRLLVDGSSAATIAFPATGNWIAWNFASTTLSLTAGTHLLRLEGTTSNGLANIDSLAVTGNAPQPATCP
jgi:carbohydrate binding protein with CBM6 domain